MQQLLNELLPLLRPTERLSASRWVEANIDLSRDPTSPTGFAKYEFSKAPHLREPVDFWSRDCGGRMTVMGVEQKGKSTIWKLGVIYRLATHPEPMLIVYPSEERAIDENRDSLEPLMRSVPHLAAALEVPFATARNCYRLGRGIVYFEGAGNAIISRRAATVIGDEISSWVLHENRVDNVRRLDHRIRQFRNGRRVLVCSPIGSGCLISQEFNKSSRGYWTLRCLGCGELTIRSCDIAGRWVAGERRGGLQFEVVGDDGAEKRAVRESIRLICPECGHEHVEADAGRMNLAGEYVHKYPELIDIHAGYQFGVLCNIPEHFPALSWLTIAEAQLKAGKSGTYSDQVNFDNSFRGLPYRERKHVADGSNAFDMILRQHVGETPDKLEFALLAVDTQDDSFYWVVRGFDRMGNSYRLDYGRAQDIEDVIRLLGRAWNGVIPSIGIQDVRGHRQREIVPILKKVHGMLMYQGFGAIRDKNKLVKWKRTGPQSKIYMATARLYQADLLYLIHRQLDKAKPFWYLPGDIGEDYAHHILALAPNERKREGDAFENWEKTNNLDHWFDCEKMILVARDILSSQPAKVVGNPAAMRQMFEERTRVRDPRKQKVRNWE